MSESTARLTDYGFAWGNAEVIRYALMPDGTRVLGIEINGKRTLDVYISPAGRSVRVFRKGKGEMTCAPVRDAEGPQIAAQSVEWGVRFASVAGDVTTGYDDEDDAKKSAAYWKDRGDPGTVMRRTVMVSAWEASQ